MRVAGAYDRNGNDAEHVLLEVPIRPDITELLRQPRVHLAIKAGASAALAWLAVLPLGGVADEYPYYAPLGAVICVSSTVAHTLRAASQAFATIFLGAALAVVAQILHLPAALAVALVVACGTLVGAWRRIALMSSYVPVSGLFVLIVGGSEPLHYVFGYLGLTTLGGAIGVLINGAFPSMPLTATRRHEDKLRTVLADQLDDLAEGLEQDALPTADQWSGRRWSIEPRTRQMKGAMAEVADATHANWRARRWSGDAHQQDVRSRALGSLAFLVEDLTVLVTSTEHADRAWVGLGPSLRPPAAHALRTTAEILRAVGGSSDQIDFEVARSAVRRLGEQTMAARAGTNDEFFTAGTVVTTLRRAHELVRSLVDDVDGGPPAGD